MEGLLEKISEELKIDKSQWTPAKFGDVAIQQKGKIDRDNTDLTRYVQGGHMNSEDLHLRSWGELEDEYLGPAFIRRFDEGDILYGSRRTYLRKVVIAPFSGITSNTTFVIRTNDKNIDKRLLPYVMMSEGFTENSVRNSKGSVNPYINWKDIAKYEFLLPPKDQQVELAKLLWVLDEMIEREKEVLEKLKIIENCVRKTEIENLNSEEFKIDDLILPMSKIKVGKIDKSNYLKEGNYPIVDQSLEFIVGYTNDENLVYKGELPVLVFGDHTTIIKYIDFHFVMGADGTKVIKPKSKLDVFYLYHAIKNLNIQPQGYRRHFSILKNSNIKLSQNDNWIKSFKNRLGTINNSIEASELKVRRSQALQKSLINQIF